MEGMVNLNFTSVLLMSETVWKRNWKYYQSEGEWACQIVYTLPTLKPETRAPIFRVTSNCTIDSKGNSMATLVLSTQLIVNLYIISPRSHAIHTHTHTHALLFNPAIHFTHTHTHTHTHIHIHTCEWLQPWRHVWNHKSRMSTPWFPTSTGGQKLIKFVCNMKLVAEDIFPYMFILAISNIPLYRVALKNPEQSIFRTLLWSTVIFFHLAG